MYERRYGLIRTLAPLHVGASAGEESGNLNLIFRDSFTQTGIIPGSSIRGRFRAEMRQINSTLCDQLFGSSALDSSGISEGLLKFEYASLVWLPVFCPGQPVVWVSCPRLLRRAASAGLADVSPKQIQDLENTGSTKLTGARVQTANDQEIKLFFNLGFMTLKRAKADEQKLLSTLVPEPFSSEVDKNRLVVVDDASIGPIHDMALYRQSRVKLEDERKIVEYFFNVEALPEGCILIFPMALNRQNWPEVNEGRWANMAKSDQIKGQQSEDIYFGGLESIGFGRCDIQIARTAQ